MIDASEALARDALVAPPYGGACLDHLIPALEAVLEGGQLEPWLPAELAGVSAIVLLVLDGLGATQLERFGEWTPTLTSASTRPISTVAPATTAAALTSLSTAVPPAEHGLVGYRMWCDGVVLNVLRWTTAGGDARARFPPDALQRLPTLRSGEIPVVTKADFVGSGFTLAHLRDAPLIGWREPGSIAPLALDALGAGHRLVYAYLDAVDHAAHQHGLGPEYEAALRLADGVAGAIATGLPKGAALVATADHGHLLRPCRPVDLDPACAELVLGCSGEGRFRWLHARAGSEEELLGRARVAHGEAASVLSRAECIGLGLLGEPGDARHAARLGDVLLIPRGDHWFVDPADTGEGGQVSRHGGLDLDETEVPVAVLVA